MLLAGLAGHQDVVHVDEGESQTIEDLIHEPLEGHTSVIEPKGHAQELKEAKVGDNGSLGDHRLLQGDLQVKSRVLKTVQPSSSLEKLARGARLRWRKSPHGRQLRPFSLPGGDSCSTSCWTLG